MGNGKEEEGTEPGLCDTGLFSADLEAADPRQGSSETRVVWGWRPPRAGLGELSDS